MPAEVGAKEVDMYLFDRGEAFGMEKDIDLFSQLAKIFELELRWPDGLAFRSSAIFPLYGEFIRDTFLTFVQVRVHP